MIDYGRYKLTFNEAKEKTDALDNMSEKEFTDQVRHWAIFDVGEDSFAESYSDLRNEVVTEFRNVLTKNGNRIDYNLDLKVGIKLYELMNPTNGYV